ncbi:hypothetical protein Avbf_10010 [Armadillidium vulgare]|nr:hypothetical protein Avbf_10010 [Armadillidium vulgare]
MYLKKKILKLPVSESLKGGAIAGCATVIGGLIMGPVGLAAGGTLGGITSFFVCKKFESVPSVISKMDPSKREMLIHRVRTVLQQHGILGASCLGNVMSNSFLRVLLIQLLGSALWAIGKYILAKLNSDKEREKQQPCTQI